MVQLPRNLQTIKTSPNSRGTSNSRSFADRVRNRVTFSRLRRTLRERHFSTLREARQGPVWSYSGALGGQAVFMEEARGLQTIKLSDDKGMEEQVFVEHPSALSKAWSFMKTLPVCLGVGGGVFGYSAAATGPFTKPEVYSNFVSGLILGTVVMAALSLVYTTTSITCPSCNQELSRFVKSGDKNALSALVRHLRREGFHSGINESEGSNGQ